MTDPIAGLVGAGMAFLAVAGLVYAGASIVATASLRSRLESLLLRHLPQSPRSNFGLRDALQVTLPLGGAIVVLALVVTGSPMLAIASLPLALLGPVLVYRRRRAERRRALELHLPAALQQLASYVSSGASLTNAFEAGAKSAPWPLNEEFQLISRGADAVGLAAALHRARERLRSESFDLMVAVIMVGLGPGGNTVAALRGLADTLVELERLRNKVSSATSQVRRTMTIISAIPVILVALAYVFQRDYVDKVTGSTLGIFLLAVAVVLWVVSILWMNRLSEVDV